MKKIYDAAASQYRDVAAKHNKMIVSIKGYKAQISSQEEALKSK